MVPAPAEIKLPSEVEGSDIPNPKNEMTVAVTIDSLSLNGRLEKLPVKVVVLAVEYFMQAFHPFGAAPWNRSSRDRWSERDDSMSCCFRDTFAFENCLGLGAYVERGGTKSKGQENIGHELAMVKKSLRIFCSCNPYNNVRSLSV